MKYLARSIMFAIFGACFIIAACGSKLATNSDKGESSAFKVAFMPDVHFHDVYAKFEDGSFNGIENPKNGQNATIRTMYAQLTSTRLFNENYFAFIAALDDAVQRGVQYIAMPGDFSDDGQPVHIRGIAKIMDEYSRKHGIQFFVLPGNHDPERPNDRASGKADYLNVTNGKYGDQKIFSRGADDCKADYSGTTALIGTTICTQEVVHQGYEGIVKPMEKYGFTPQPEYVYYETPYSSYSYKDYNFKTAVAQASWTNRQYEICTEGTGGEYKEDGYTNCQVVRDTSYLVEPVEGVWLVAIDSNVYIPSGKGANDFSGSGDNGWNKMLTHKKQVVKWLADVVARGEAQGKKVVAFSHYPMIEFFDGASDAIEGFLGAGKMQISRRPTEATSKALAETGLRVHVGGHMHFNDTGYRNVGGSLFNIQAPSMAAYVPAYKIMTLQNADEIELETVVLKDVPRFDELFELYRLEHKSNPTKWNDSILEAKDYADFNYRYMSELVRLRLLGDYWYPDMRELAKANKLTGADLLVLSQLKSSTTLGQVENSSYAAKLSPEFFKELSEDGKTTRSNNAFNADLAAAKASAEKFAQANGLQLSDFEDWSVLDMAGDFARLSNAGDLAYADISKERAQEYILLAKALDATNPIMEMNIKKVSRATPIGDMFQARFKPLTAIMLKFTEGIPSAHVRLNLKTGEVVDLSGTASPFEK